MMLGSEVYIAYTVLICPPSTHYLAIHVAFTNVLVLHVLQAQAPPCITEEKVHCRSKKVFFIIK